MARRIRFRPGWEPRCRWGRRRATSRPTARRIERTSRTPSAGAGRRALEWPSRGTPARAREESRARVDLPRERRRDAGARAEGRARGHPGRAHARHALKSRHDDLVPDVDRASEVASLRVSEGHLLRLPVDDETPRRMRGRPHDLIETEHRRRARDGREVGQAIPRGRGQAPDLVGEPHERLRVVVEHRPEPRAPTRRDLTRPRADVGRREQHTAPRVGKGGGTLANGRDSRGQRDARAAAAAACELGSRRAYMLRRSPSDGESPSASSAKAPTRALDHCGCADACVGTPEMPTPPAGPFL